MGAESISIEAVTLSHVALDPYQAAILAWLQGKADGTRRAYGRHLGAFLHATEKHPSGIEPPDAARWKELLKWRGLVDAVTGHSLRRPGSELYHTGREATRRLGESERTTQRRVAKDEMPILALATGTDQGLTDAFSECLTQLEQETGSVDACLEHHQDKADALRPLLSLAEQLRQYPRPVQRRAARQAGKHQMLAKVARRCGNRASMPA